MRWIFLAGGGLPMPRSTGDVSAQRQPYNRYPSWPAPSGDARLTLMGIKKTVGIDEPHTAPAVISGSNRKFTVNFLNTGCNVGWFLWTIFSNFWNYYFLLCCLYMRPSARCGGYAWPVLLKCYQHLEIFSEIWVMPCYLQFHGHHSNFRKDFQMLVAAKEGEI